MELESKVKDFEVKKSVRNQEGSKPSSSQVYQVKRYNGIQVALAQHSTDYCGDGMGDGCSND